MGTVLTFVMLTGLGPFPGPSPPFGRVRKTDYDNIGTHASEAWDGHVTLVGSRSNAAPFFPPPILTGIEHH
jgi:hypothetical protein